MQPQPPMRLYGDLAERWYALLDPREDHADEAQQYHDVIERRAAGTPRTLLELGAGAGNNAWYLQQRFACTLAEPSAAMRALSMVQNPRCEHVDGDMRSLRLARAFDAVLVHDAVMYMTSRAELLAAMHTARAHLRPGGVALFAPDVLAGQLGDRHELIVGDAADGRAMRGLCWCWDPDPRDECFVSDYTLLLRETDGSVQALHERHVEGFFGAETWMQLLRAAGFDPHRDPRPLDEPGWCEEVFVGIAV